MRADPFVPENIALPLECRALVPALLPVHLERHIIVRRTSMSQPRTERKELLSPEPDISISACASSESLEHLSMRMHLELAALERRRSVIATRMCMIRHVIAGLAALFEVDTADSAER